jgi:hypothetical protein
VPPAEPGRNDVVRREPAATRPTLGVRILHACEWIVVIVVPAVVGGVIGGSIGGIVTAALLVPSFDRLLRRGDRAWVARVAHRRSERPPVHIPRAAPSLTDRQDSVV